MASLALIAPVSIFNIFLNFRNHYCPKMSDLKKKDDDFYKRLQIEDDATFSHPQSDETQRMRDQVQTIGKQEDDSNCFSQSGT